MIMSSTSSHVETRCNTVILGLIGATDGGVDFGKVAGIVNDNSGTQIPLVKPKSYNLRVCGQEDTVYAGNDDQLDSWEDHYLSERKKMQVIGAIDDFSCEAFGRQLVLLLCEDKRVYAYEDEVLHVVAESLEALFDSGVIFPGKEVYNFGECFEEYTEDEYNEMMEFSEIKEMKEKHQQFRDSLESDLLKALKEFDDKQLKKRK
ncbi:uncharacterized protein [Hoplias malabaricus]|uniref:uncharacterized protein isoform X2 n=1 Tax=Hoplias malabaricus TaxID=27720 RepID=UPI0034617D46